MDEDVGDKEKGEVWARTYTDGKPLADRLVDMMRLDAPGEKRGGSLSTDMRQ